MFLFQYFVLEMICCKDIAKVVRTFSGRTALNGLYPNLHFATAHNTPSCEHNHDLRACWNPDYFSDILLIVAKFTKYLKENC